MSKLFEHTLPDGKILVGIDDKGHNAWIDHIRKDWKKAKLLGKLSEITEDQAKELGFDDLITFEKDLILNILKPQSFKETTDFRDNVLLILIEEL